MPKKGRPKDKGQRRAIARSKDGNPYRGHGRKGKSRKKQPYNRNQQNWEE